IFGRAIANALQPALKQTVLVENKPGAGGNIGMAYVARAKADGYTLGLGTIGTQTINQFLYSNMTFDPERDLVPIALVSTTPNVIAVSAKSPYKTVADVIQAARQSKDKKLTYASPG
ncbi:tripartite tricarboxylate transporter substrate binding protein, partial [Klebsiella pneumoniae]|nr:tripartite tricarboxylate transporter substrate binding protein [Klebsiella pneumoniae]